MPAAFPLEPEFIAAAAEKMGLAGGDGLVESRPIHPRHHQDLARSGVLNDRGNQAVVV